jgi:hypothetical protein
VLTIKTPLVLTLPQFLADPQGRRCRDVVASPEFEPSFQKALDILNRSDCQERMRMAEIYFHQPAIAGAAHELEDLLAAVKFFATQSQFNRFKQALGVAVRILMEQMGWKKTVPPVEERVLVGTQLSRARRYDPPPADMSLFPEQVKKAKHDAMRKAHVAKHG